VHVGKWKILETGLFPDSFLLRKAGGAEPGQQISKGSSYGSFGKSDGKAPTALEEGKKDFIEIAALGTGASGVVSEAVHIPTLTIVALKMLPVYNQEKRRHVARELGVLYKNLAELKLIDETLHSISADDNSSDFKHPSDTTPGLRKPACENILSLYNAFADPKSGMINLVIEYMDGGSLEDLVRQGGCKDEQVLADIARQTLSGLSFLHRHKNVHRDIKPANILCSSNGVIKIADFGISKALDKTNGFANSFVGTICYMAP
jgi:serine/threonine protein kinase